MDYYSVIRKAIRKSRISKSEEFVYSDLFFYMVPELVEKWTGVRFEDYLNINFYQPMGANSLCFNPSDKFILSEIVPTELDTFFRKTQIHGKVHDEGAILMGGISGHAGLFGNAGDAAKIWRMYLNGGVYQGHVFLKESTLNLFTTTQFPNTGNRRGLGFDKPLLEYDSIKSSVARSVSGRSFGHSGFTGTLIWADPEYDLVFIFLSNRVYPSRSNTMIYQLNVRPTIHQILYDEITKARPISGI